MTALNWQRVAVRIALLPALATAVMASTAFASCPLPSTALRQGAVQAAWAPDTPPISVGRHFTIQVRLCPADAVLARVDATMPAHRHGMNYRPSIKAMGAGLWHVEGLMFHMPGAWELRLDVQAGGRTETLRDAVTLP
ncbi:hypothetical protein O4H66_05950 [Comamonadaceae bacterium G21597-S1]|nr:hypothetical protein [Comamonadaceae bacterium G21597-S1]